MIFRSGERKKKEEKEEEEFEKEIHRLQTTQPLITCIVSIERKSDNAFNYTVDGYL